MQIANLGLDYIPVGKVFPVGAAGEYIECRRTISAVNWVILPEGYFQGLRGHRLWNCLSGSGRIRFLLALKGHLVVSGDTMSGLKQGSMFHGYMYLNWSCHSASHVHVVILGSSQI